MLTITHTPEAGTLIEGTSRGDGTAEILKANGWRWGRSIGAWYVPQSRDRLPKWWTINRAATALRDAGHEVTIEADERAQHHGADQDAHRVAVHQPDQPPDQRIEQPGIGHGREEQDREQQHDAGGGEVLDPVDHHRAQARGLTGKDAEDRGDDDQRDERRVEEEEHAEQPETHLPHAVVFEGGASQGHG